jgi:hypothetical protein
MIKFVCELWQVDGFIDTLVPPPIKLTVHDIAEMLLKVALSTNPRLGGWQIFF